MNKTAIVIIKNLNQIYHKFSKNIYNNNNNNIEEDLKKLTINLK